MKRFLISMGCVAVAVIGLAATVTKVSEYSNVGTLRSSDLLLVAQPDLGANANIRWEQVTAILAGGGLSGLLVTNTIATNGMTPHHSWMQSGTMSNDFYPGQLAISKPAAPNIRFYQSGGGPNLTAFGQISLQNYGMLLSTNTWVTGWVTALGFVGDGSGLYNVRAMVSNAVTVPLTSKGYASQATNLFEAVDSGGAVVACISSNGVYYGNGGGLTNLPGGSGPSLSGANTWSAANTFTGGVSVSKAIYLTDGMNPAFGATVTTTGGNAWGNAGIMGYNIAQTCMKSVCDPYYSPTINGSGAIGVYGLSYPNNGSGGAGLAIGVEGSGASNGNVNNSYNFGVIGRAQQIQSATYNVGVMGLAFPSTSGTAGGFLLWNPTASSQVVPTFPTCVIAADANTNNVPLFYGIQSNAYRVVINANGDIGTVGSVTASNGLILPGINYIKVSPVTATGHSQYSGSGNAYIFGLTNGALQAEIYVKDGGGNVTLISPHSQEAPASLYDDADPFPNITSERNDYLGVIRWINKSREALVAQGVIEVMANSYEAWCGIQAGANVALLKNNNVWATNRVNWASSAMGTNWYLAMKEFVKADQAGRVVTTTETYAQYNARTGAGLAQVSWSSVQNRLSNEVFAAYAEATNAYAAALATYNAAYASGDTNATVPVNPGAYVPRSAEPVPAWLYQRGVR
jgi:hypothetical protein